MLSPHFSQGMRPIATATVLDPSDDRDVYVEKTKNIICRNFALKSSKLYKYWLKTTNIFTFTQVSLY